MVKRLKPLGLVLLFVVLLALPSLVRAAYYYRGLYAPPQVPRPNLTTVDVATAVVGAFEDAGVEPGKGQVVIDQAHSNTVGHAELNVLLARLTARGIQAAFSLDPLAGPDGVPSDLLRAAAALVVVSPHEPFTADEARAVTRFVQRGGRLVLIGDPSRYSLVSQGNDAGSESLQPESDVTALNSLATWFGLAFADDYLYNTTQNAGNFQYIVLRDFAQGNEHPVTAGLQEVIFFAAHSIAVGEQHLIVAGEDTISSLSEQNGGLAAVSLGGKGRVLAIGDMTFMTEPYNSAGDNNHLIANIAGFIAGAKRAYGLADFPSFLGDDVDLISAMDPAGEQAFQPKAIAQAARLQSALDLVGKNLHWRTMPVPGHDAFYLGLYKSLQSWPDVTKILATQGISFTLETLEELPAPVSAPYETPTPARQSTAQANVAPDISATLLPTARPLRDWIHLGGIAQVEAREAALFYQNEHGGRQVLVVLAFDEEGLVSAIQRLLDGNYVDCLVDHDLMDTPEFAAVALCPTVYEAPEATPVPVPTAEAEPGTRATPVAEGGILVVSDDDGEGTYDWWTSAYDLAEIARTEGYQAVLWSTSLDGQVTLEQMTAHKAVIWCTGDYREDGTTPEEEDLTNLLSYVGQGGRLMLSGAFIGSPDTSERGLLLDVKVLQAGHPLAEGFEQDQVIQLRRFTAKEDYTAHVLQEADPASIVLARGPDSVSTSAPALTVNQDDELGSKMILMGFPIFLLPQNEERLLAGNAIRWLMSE